MARTFDFARGSMEPGSRRVARGSGAPRSGGWVYQVLRGAEQALDDVARAETASVVLVRHPRGASAAEYLDGLEASAGAAGFVTAHVEVLADSAFDSLEALVEASLRSVRVPGVPRSRRGVCSLLDAFIRSHGTEAAAEIEGRIVSAGLTGDLIALAQGHVVAAAAGLSWAPRIESWLSGVELARSGADASEVAALSARTAKRALADLTRLVRLLGWRGTLLVFEGADVIANLPPARREAAYTVIRELVDNADGGRGLVAAHVVIAASTSLFTGPRSMASLPALATRVELPEGASMGGPPPPHRPVIDLAPADDAARAELPEVRSIDDASAPALRALVRGAHGLPPVEAAPEMSVGHERIDHAIDALFEHSSAAGSVFALITGAYGSGKTHFLLHLAARALADRRPVLRLSLERLDMDLGHPERHLARLLEHASLPPSPSTPHRAVGPLDRLLSWTRTPRGLGELAAALRAIQAEGGEAADAAERALGIAAKAPRAAAALESHLSGVDLAQRASSVGARRDAYGRLLLWLALLERLDGCGGPVLLIDEAENLYRGAATRPERRTALRSLSFYCGGALPRACVALAITPDALAELQAEAPTLLDDVAEQRTLLPWEDASMLCRRLERARPLPVPSLGADQRTALAERVRATHASVRGALPDPGWDAYVAHLVGRGAGPREIVRQAVDRLERVWWSGDAPRASVGRARLDAAREPRRRRL